MNKTHRLLWNTARNAWTVAHEAAATHGKPGSPKRRLLGILAGALIANGASAAAPTPPPANALPSGGQVVAGQATISQAGNAMTIRQGTDKAILNWQSFTIGGQASVNFQQPGSNSVALNRVIGADPSAIYGNLTANGQVFLINPNGVLFGQGAKVDVGGLVASTLGLRNDDFLNGNYRFTRDGATGAVTNQGDIFASYVALLAPEVRNEGVIAARMGTAALAAGESVTLGITGNKLIDVTVGRAAIDTLVENKRLVTAEEGTVVMSAQSANHLLGRVINSGTASATGITSDGGVVRLLGSSGVEHSGTIDVGAATLGKGGTAILLANLANPDSRTTVSGSISARGGSRGGDGGLIETSGSHLTIADTARVDTTAANGRSGTWLLDPISFTVAASNGDMTGATLSGQLATTNVTLSAQCATANNCSPDPSVVDGDIFVNDSVKWGSNSGVSNTNTLTLDAGRNIYINAPLDATYNSGAAGTGTGKLALQVAQSNFASAFPMGIYTVSAPVTLPAGQNFTVTTGKASGTDLDAPIVDSYTVLTTSGTLAAVTTNDASVRYALGKDITTSGNWTPIGSFASPFLGFFNGLGHTVSNITIPSANGNYVGLFGAIGNLGSVQNLGVINASVAGLTNVGALAGSNMGMINNVYATGSVTGDDTATNVNHVYAIGGLIGNNGGPVNNAYANVAVTATTGLQDTGSPTDGGIGGLIGVNQGTIGNTYATGNVSGVRDVGGLVGWNWGAIGASYATGTVAGTTNVGSVVGFLNNPTNMPWLFDTFWISNNGATTSASDGLNASTRIDPANASNTANWGGFDFAHTTWVINGGGSRPLLTSMLQPIYVIADNKNPTYNGVAFSSFTNTIAAGNATGGGTDYTLGTVSITPSTASPTNANTYTLTPSGGITLTNPDAQQAYYLAYVNGTLTIAPRPITVQAANQSRTYGSANPTTDTVTLTGGTTLGAGDILGTASASSTATSTTAAGQTAPLTPSNQTFSVGSTSNYIISYADGTLSITPRPLNVTVSKSYNSTASFTNANGFTFTGMANSEAMPTVSSGSAAVSSPNASTTAYTSFVANTLVLSDGNYTATGGTISAMINKAQLQYVADAATMASEATVPALSGSVTGFVGPDTLANATTGLLSFSTPATSTSPAGSYPITGSGLSSINYNFVQAAGNNTALTVSPAPASRTLQTTAQNTVGTTVNTALTTKSSKTTSTGTGSSGTGTSTTTESTSSTDAATLLAGQTSTGTGKINLSDVLAKIKVQWAAAGAGTDTLSIVDGIYRAVTGGGASFDGLLYWANVIDSGRANRIQALAQILRATDETTKINGLPTDDPTGKKLTSMLEAYFK